MDSIKFIVYAIYVALIMISILGIVLGILWGLPSSTLIPPFGTQTIWEYILFCSGIMFILSILNTIIIYIIFTRWIPKGYTKDPDFPDGFES